MIVIHICEPLSPIYIRKINYTIPVNSSYDPCFNSFFCFTLYLVHVVALEAIETNLFCLIWHKGPRIKRGLDLSVLIDLGNGYKCFAIFTTCYMKKFFFLRA